MLILIDAKSHVYYKIFYNKRILWFEGLLFRFFAKIILVLLIIKFYVYSDI